MLYYPINPNKSFRLRRFVGLCPTPRRRPSAFRKKLPPLKFPVSAPDIYNKHKHIWHPCQRKIWKVNMILSKNHKVSTHLFLCELLISNNINTGVDDSLWRGLGGGPKRIATVVRFSKFFFAWKIQKNDDGPLFSFFNFFDFLRL